MSAPLAAMEYARAHSLRAVRQDRADAGPRSHERLVLKGLAGTMSRVTGVFPRRVSLRHQLRDTYPCGRQSGLVSGSPAPFLAARIRRGRAHFCIVLPERRAAVEVDPPVGFVIAAPPGRGPELAPQGEEIGRNVENRVDPSEEAWTGGTGIADGPATLRGRNLTAPADPPMLGRDLEVIPAWEAMVHRLRAEPGRARRTVEIDGRGMETDRHEARSRVAHGPGVPAARGMTHPHLVRVAGFLRPSRDRASLVSWWPAGIFRTLNSSDFLMSVTHFHRNVTSPAQRVARAGTARGRDETCSRRS